MADLGYHTVQRVLGLKRSNWQKVLPGISLLVAFVPAIAVIGFVAIEPSAADLELGESADYYFWITGALFLFAAFVAPEAVCTDRRSGLLGLYLASPLGRDTYLATKFIAIATVLAVMTIGPPLLMLVAYTLAGVGPDGVNGWLTELGRVLASGVAWPLAVFWGALSLAVSSLTPRRTRASVAIFLSPLVSAAVGDGLAAGAEVGDSFALMNLIALPFEAVYRIYGQVSDPNAPIGQVESWELYTALIGLIFAFGWFARWSYQRIEVAG